MNNTQLLIDKFMAGKTSREEERLLTELLKSREQTAEDSILLAMLEMPKLELDTNVLTEVDYSDEYDTIVNRRKHRTVIMRWAVAASIIAAVVMISTWCGYGDDSIEESKPTMVIAKTNSIKSDPAALKIIQQKDEPISHATKPKPLLLKKKIEETKQAPPLETLETMTAEELTAQLLAENKETSYADSLAYYVDRIEQDLENVSDSIYLSRVQKVIAADEKLQKIVNRIILESMESESKPQEAANNTYEQ